MKKFLSLAKISLLSVLFILFSLTGMSKNIKTSDDGKSQIKVVSSSELSLRMINQTGQIKMDVIGMTEGDYARLSIPQSSKSTLVGYPNLPVKRKLIQIPFGAEPVVTIKSFEVKEYALADYGIGVPVQPVQQPEAKCGDSPEFICNTAVYKTDAFLNSERVTVDVLGIMRGVRIARVNIYPVEYNPVQNTIKVYENIDFEITYQNADLGQTTYQKEKYFSPYFKGVFHKLANYTQTNSRENSTQYPVKYVVVSNRMFEDGLQTFIAWKKQKGFLVEEAYTDVIGDSKEEIKAYLQDLYENGTEESPAPSFVLFVGDIDQMPTWNNGDGVTDRNYVEFTGDLFPEIFYGRFSAENTTQLQPYVDKTLQYEQYTMPDPSYLEEVVLVAGMDGSHGNDWGNGQINYGTINYFNEDHDIFSHTYLYPESGSNAANIKQDISEGATFVNYSAHCGPSGWSDPSFTISDIPALTNQDMYGLIIGNCCSSSEYQTTCFAEEIVRTANKGAVGYIGGSNSTYWDEDYYFGVGVGEISEDPPSYDETTLGNYDRSFHENGETFGDWYVTMDQVLFAGNLAVSESGSGLEEYYWDIYNLIGDPSLMIYYGIPSEINADHDPMIIIGGTSFTIETEPYAYIALNMDGENKAVALADENGVAVLSFEPFDAPGTAELVITAQNFQPYFGEVLVITPNGPFCIYQQHTINDSLGNGNNIAEYMEDVFVSMMVENFGNEDAMDVQVIISTSNTYVTLVDNNESYGDIMANEQVSKANGYRFVLAETVPDQMKLEFEVMTVDSNDSVWYSDFSITANAPEFDPRNLIVLDNENGRLDPGETAIIQLETKNSGHCPMENVVASFQAFNPYITVLTGDITIDNIGIMETVYPEFWVMVSEDAPEGFFVEMRYFLNCGNINATKSYFPKVGALLEDWETGDFQKFNWEITGDAEWTINEEEPYEGAYDAKSAPMEDLESTQFSINYEVISDDSVAFYKKVSSEATYDFLLFYIDDEEKGKWSGTDDDWSRQAYAVSAGNHQFTWKYEKDYSMSEGDDCAWIDYITLPTMMVTTVYAGPDDAICSSLGVFQCNGTATNYDTIYWTTSGSGTFSDINIFDPLYTASEEDASNGEVELSLNIVDMDGNTAVDMMNLLISSGPSQPALPVGPESVNIEETTESEYMVDEVNGADAYSWFIYPMDAGTISGDGANASVIWTETYIGEVWIKVNGLNDCGAGQVSDSLKVTLYNSLGIDPIEGLIGVDVMPNPNDGRFKLNFKSDVTEEISIKILNHLGQTVFEKEMISVDKSYSTTIELGDVKNGIYFLVIENENQKQIKKLMINR